MVGVKVLIRAPMLDKLWSPVYYARGNNQLWENHTRLQRATNDLPGRRLRGGRCRNLKMSDGLRVVRRKSTRRRVGRGGSRELCVGINLVTFRRGWRIEKLVDLLRGVRGRRGATTKDRRQREDDHFGDVSQDTGGGRGASGGPRVPRRI